MNNKIYTVIIILCLALAIVMIGRSCRRNRDGIESVKVGQIWVKCNNADCRATYQMDMKVYFEQVKQKANTTGGIETPPLLCKQCQKDSLYRAVKCEKCGEVFFYHTGSPDFPDRCPKCGYSKKEHDRKEAAAGQGG